MNNLKKSFLKAFVGLSFLVSMGCAVVNIPTPHGMTDGPDSGASAEKVLSFFDSIPYREDGAINKAGDFTLFADQQARFDTSGLNCSGFTVAASRYFFKRDYVLNDVMIDRLADSGPDAENGEDWDFGYDVILNLTEGMDRKVMLPFGKNADISSSNGMTLRGFDLHDLKAWTDVISKMKKGSVYLFSMSKPVSFKNYKLLHYHVGVIVPDGEGHVWLCHATHKAGVNKVDITSLENLKRVVDANPDSKLGKRMILIVEAPLK
ncbi:hypothetical protein [Desulfovibrio gilichinskyi]|uniref:Uncharacterized protein n=1 Tax=Desulfovibrio gilichinskyi TaxID=1519643 RepID=A0A1X7CXW1_9BACT|nr:hypothetical protein [Desulfovibrio gilichinskyi]SMF04640.1 hypothetical protein SAMN06295933_1371 [Desulfovibrio gilichinskyi]